jgi:hypothetical protein
VFVCGFRGASASKATCAHLLLKENKIQHALPACKCAQSRTDYKNKNNNENITTEKAVQGSASGVRIKTAMLLRRNSAPIKHLPGCKRAWQFKCAQNQGTEKPIRM